MLDIIRSCGLALALLVWVATTIATKHHLPDAAVVAGLGHRRKRASTKKTDPRLSPNRLNANRGTERGQRALDRSLREYGPGRSVLTHDRLSDRIADLESTLKEYGLTDAPSDGGRRGRLT